MTSKTNENKHKCGSHGIAWQKLTSSDSIAKLESNAVVGLASDEVSVRLQRYGFNELARIQGRTWPGILLAQLKSSLVVLLVVATLISVALGESTDAIAIAVIVVLNTVLGFCQDFRAEKALAELKKLDISDVTVRRDGTTTLVAASNLVPGDIVELREGFFVPADCRIIEKSELAIDESALTGESLQVSKTTQPILLDDLPIGDRKNLAFKGTVVVRGRGLAMVVSTGMRTELGKIANSLQSVETEPTPLQYKLGQLSRMLSVGALFVVAMVFLAGWAGGNDARLMLLTAISMAVALVPEGLPAVATVALAIGARQMFKRNALIRQLPAVETLGSVSVICSDKTGTLTQNRMVATNLELPNQQITVSDGNVDPGAQPLSLALMLTAATLCNDAKLVENTHDTFTAVGEPTEKALVEVAAKFGFIQSVLQINFPRFDEIPFDSVRKRMTTIHDVTIENNDHFKLSESIKRANIVPNTGDRIAFIKGAVDSLLEISSYVWHDGQKLPLDQIWMDRIQTSRDKLAAQGTRVLAISFRKIEPIDNTSNVESEAIFVGMIGLSDPLRPEAKHAVERCSLAGIRPIMITGDHPLTAINIANKLGISNNERVINGQQLSKLDANALREQVKTTNVYARVAPSDKLKIVEALQHNHEVVAMTGDGVNDAPALKQASVGVAMGITGTDVSKQAANVVLMDDNFASIVSAVQQGRNVYDNIIKFIKYAMSGNVGEVLVMTIGIIFGMPLPLLPLQILWVNLVTDGLPGLALALEPADQNAMKRPPLPLDEPIFNWKMNSDLLWIGSWICLASLTTGWLVWNENKGIEHWRTLIFTVLTLSQMANVFACRSDRPVLFEPNMFANVWLWAAVVCTFALQIVVLYFQPMQQIFRTTPLNAIEFSSCIVASMFVFSMIELRKYFCGAQTRQN